MAYRYGIDGLAPYDPSDGFVNESEIWVYPEYDYLIFAVYHQFHPLGDGT